MGLAEHAGTDDDEAPDDQSDGSHEERGVDDGCQSRVDRQTGEEIFWNQEEDQHQAHGAGGEHQEVGRSSRDVGDLRAGPQLELREP
ncbi:MAG: hypothetical protein VW780_07665 [Actinomycetota bacterium]